MGDQRKETSSKFAALRAWLSRRDAAGHKSSPESTTAAPYGVHVWVDCADATVDICFIHGLTGDRDRTWTAHAQQEPWPRTLLAPELKSARILTYGYDAYYLGKDGVASQNRLTDHAQNLINELATNRRLHGASTRPIVFVAHSLGGIVCKKAVLLSHGHPDPALEDIFKCTKGIIFMGTPHRGAWMVKWAKVPVKVLGMVKSTNVGLLKALGSGEELLESIQQDFGHLLQRMSISKTPIEITCFYEELTMSPTGQTVVSRDSATIPNYNAISIHANHREMVWFDTREDRGFIEVSNLLKKWQHDVEPIYEACFARHQTPPRRFQQLSRSPPPVSRSTEAQFDLQQDALRPRGVQAQDGRDVHLPS
ncbi:Alpha/Beta hydrolase protein [Immersiella caudata]|uniref:Alpha/Beta hydrolase protein n=1 Tax=Immersiella caudata TaxID=314043 RepID=A0AA39WLW7_9PEZI|nr:Alpha/Beta hydrolase protein [Immersiella caudata]